MKRIMIFRVGFAALAVVSTIGFWLAGRKYRSDAFESIDEKSFARGVAILDSLHGQMTAATLSRDPARIANASLQWETHKQAFEQAFRQTIGAPLAAQVLVNFDHQSEAGKAMLSAKSSSANTTSDLREMLEDEKARKDELKAEIQMIKQALFTL